MVKTDCVGKDYAEKHYDENWKKSTHYMSSVKTTTAPATDNMAHKDKNFLSAERQLPQICEIMSVVTQTQATGPAKSRNHSSRNPK
jgi:hypothetical protein